MINCLTLETFKQKVFNFEKNSKWAYQGTTPCVIEFYAPWNGSSNTSLQHLACLAKDFYKKPKVFGIDVEEETELTDVLGIQNIPSYLFVPVNGQPKLITGSIKKEELYEQAMRMIDNKVLA